MKETSLLIPVVNPDVQSYGQINWVPTIGRCSDGSWRNTYWGDEEVVERCKVFFCGCRDKKGIIELLEKDGCHKMAARCRQTSLNPSAEMIAAVKDGNWHWMLINLKEVIYLDCCPDKFE